MTPVRQYYSMAARAKEKFLTLLHTRPNEKAVLTFFEQNPSLIIVDPNNPLLISQPPLGPHFRSHLTFFSDAASERFLHIVKFESARLEMFSAADALSADFNRTLREVQEPDWCKSGNRDISGDAGLKPLIDLCGHESRKDVRLDLMVVAGRQSEFFSAERRRNWRQAARRLPPYIRIRTYDRFIEELPLVSNFIDSVPQVRCVIIQPEAPALSLALNGRAAPSTSRWSSDGSPEARP